MSTTVDTVGSEVPEANDPRHQLRAAADELATLAMLEQIPGESANKAVPSLMSLSKDARRAGLVRVADIAGEVARALAGPHSGNTAVLLDGIARIQASIDDDSAGNPATEENAESSPEQNEQMPWASDPAMVSEFFMESSDHLESIEGMLLTLEQDAGNKDALNSVFRSFHTTKGLAGFIGFPTVQLVAHEVETLLDSVRQGRLTLRPEVIDVVLASADHLKRELERLQRMIADGTAGEPVDPGPLLELVRMAGQESKAPPSVEAEVVASPESVQVPAPPIPGSAQASTQDATKQSTPQSTVEPTRPARPQSTRQSNQASPVPTETHDPEVAHSEIKKPAAVESRLVKVDTEKLDFLVDMAGELAIAQSMIEHDGNLQSTANPRLQRNLSQLARITAEVQKTAMAMRMVPIGQLFQKSARLVRDLTRKSGKRAELELGGEDTELDRTVVEQLSDPLMHMIRNATDHGIESPEDRTAVGKNPTATIRLRAYHQAGCIVVEVGDDGRGLDRQKILNKAVERGLIHEGATLSDKEVYALIFEAGFSTAEKITDVSGRGVGMDVVRKHLQALRGRIDIESQPGRGSTFFLKLPLTLAIIDGLVVKVGEERYIIPIYAVREIFRPKVETRFTLEDRDEMVLVRGNLLPVTRLSQCFGISSRAAQLHEGVLVVVETLGKSFCVFVDEVIGKNEVVIKNLGETFKGLPGISGGAILGDGRVGLILDMDTLLGKETYA